MFKYFILFLSMALILGCGATEFSPNQKFSSSSPVNVNASQIARLAEKQAGPTIRIAVSSDTHTDYTDSKAFVDYVNAAGDFDFVMLNGDLTNFGLLTEFEGIQEIYAGLKIPFITVIGNHDENAQGVATYKRMFGETNFTFTYGGVKFVCHDANSREHKFDGTAPDLGWLQNNLSLEAADQHIVAFSHVPPIDADFDQNLRDSYERLLNNTPGMLASIHSHRHSVDSVYTVNGTGIPFITTNTILNRTFTAVEISNAQIKSHPVTF